MRPLRFAPALLALSIAAPLSAQAPTQVIQLANFRYTPAAIRDIGAAWKRDGFESIPQRLGDGSESLESRPAGNLKLRQHGQWRP